MVQNNISQQAYAQAVGTAPTNFPVIFQRDPTVYDIYYPIGQFWINQGTKSLWYLNSQSNSSGQLLSVWELISVASVLVSLSDTVNTPVFPSLPTDTPPDNIQFVGGTGISVVSTPASHLITISSVGAGAETLTGQDGVAVGPNGGGTILTLGNVVANNTNVGFPLYTLNSAANTEQWDIQVTAAIAATDITRVGLSAFSNAQFSVDANGFVTLKGGSTAPVIGLTPDTTSGGGTSPVLPNGSGDIIVTHAANFATGTQANSVRTISTAANTLAIQVQLAGGNAAVSTANDYGVAQFDTNSFGIASGFVTLKNGGTTGAVTNLIGDDTLPVVPTAGAITLDGVVVANSTHAKAVFFAKNATSIEELDVQLAAAIASTNVTKVGLAAFNNTQFSVDANGFVSISAAATGIVNIGVDSGFTPLTGTTVNLNGGANFATGTQANAIAVTAPVDNTHGVVAVQLAGSNAATSTANNFGISQFDSNMFTVTSGFVQLKGGGVNPALTSINLDAGTSPIVPSASGAMTFTGAQVATGVVGTNVIRTDGTGVNTMSIQIQRSTTSASTNAALNGVCHFSSANFTVDANGFVQSVGGSGSLSTLTGNTGGAISPVAGNINTVGTGSITIAGSGNTLTTQLTGLTNHAVQVGAGTATLTQVGPTATTGAVLQNNAGADPTYSTASYPSTTTINQLLYSSSNNVVAGLSTANSAVLVTTSGGVPGWSSTMTNGQLIIGSTGATPSANTLTAGSGISITNGAGTITISATSSTLFTYKNVNHAASPYTVLSTDQYISCDTSAGTVTLLFPNAPTSFQSWIVKDRLGTASTSNISITTVGGGDTIDGLTTYKITSNYGAVQLLFNSTGYEIF